MSIFNDATVIDIQVDITCTLVPPPPCTCTHTHTFMIGGGEQTPHVNIKHQSLFSYFLSCNFNSISNDVKLNLSILCINIT